MYFKNMGFIRVLVRIVLALLFAFLSIASNIALRMLYGFPTNVIIVAIASIVVVAIWITIETKLSNNRINKLKAEGRYPEKEPEYKDPEPVKISTGLIWGGICILLLIIFAVSIVNSDVIL